MPKSRTKTDPSNRRGARTASSEGRRALRCPAVLVGLTLLLSAPAAATEDLEVACSDGDPAACHALGLLLESDEPPGRDRARALGLFSVACRAELAAACLDEGILLLDGVAGEDASRAVEALESGCDLGSAGACSLLGTLHREGRGVDIDIAEARNLHREGCDGGNVLGCHHLAFALLHGDGGPRDLAGAAGGFSTACDGGVAEACLELGILVERGEGVEADARRAAGLYARACDEGWGGACNNLAVLHHRGDLDGTEPAVIVGLLQRACDLEPEGSGCSNLEGYCRTVDVDGCP